jgi:serine/tyrosine/threonine adenylyltransferase
MDDIISKISQIGWRFDNSYARLPEIMFSRLVPVPVQKPKLMIFNYSLAEELGLNFSALSDKDLSITFSGNLLPQGSEPIAQAYAGHQFGHFTMLGDGRAILIGEHLTVDKKRVDIQLKGSGETPFSRGGDGRAPLEPMLREYIISEAIHALGIPTTRSLAVVNTGETVIRKTLLPGAILTRIADSHIRVGTFQYLAMLGDVKTLKALVHYVIDRHYPNLKGTSNPALTLLQAVMEKQTKLIINWMRVGFIHGVMNTDNMSISGETIDYGPCAFMDTYNPETVFSSIDKNGRYAYINQPIIAEWNLLRLAETLLPLIHEKQEKAIEMATETMNTFIVVYKKHWLEMMRKKLGLFRKENEDETLITDLLSWMQKNKADYINTFCSLPKKDIKKDKLFQDSVFQNWYQRWQKRLTLNKKSIELSFELMRHTNPVIIPRNHKVEEALNAAGVNGDFKLLYDLIEVLKKPYEDRPEIKIYQDPPKPSNYVYQTFCGT